MLAPGDRSPAEYLMTGCLGLRWDSWQVAQQAQANDSKGASRSGDGSESAPSQQLLREFKGIPAAQGTQVQPAKLCPLRKPKLALGDVFMLTFQLL